MINLADYRQAILALGALGLIYLIQLLVADVAGIKAKHPPGTPVTGGHEQFLFRAARTHANTTESIGIVILFSAFAIGVNADAAALSMALWSVVFFRTCHGLAYYFNVKIARSIAFALMLVALGSVGVIGAMAL